MEKINIDDWNLVAPVSKSNTWDFSAEPVIEGVLIKKQSGVGQYGSWLYTIQTEDDGEFGVWGGSGLDGQMASINVRQQVKIVFEGSVLNERNGRTFKSYKVYSKPLDDDDIPVIEAE